MGAKPLSVGSLQGERQEAESSSTPVAGYLNQKTDNENITVVRRSNPVYPTYLI
jgi:hypothetical protein